MRRRILLAGGVLAMLSACQSEPGFDEKFEQRSRELTQKARRIEADANAQLAAAREAEQAEAELARPVSEAAR